MKPGRHQFPSTSIALRIAVIATVALLAMPCVVPQSFGADDDAESQRAPVRSDPAEERMKDFVSVVLADTEDTWGAIFAAGNARYEAPKLVLFTDAVRSACGNAQSAMGPFYCPGDHKVYIDLSFYRDLTEKLGAPGDFAQAYVIAHEIGHHVQNLTGTAEKVLQAQQRASSKAEANQYSVMLELQADCYAGVWARDAAPRLNITQADIEEGLRAATAIGDDTLQRATQGRVVPDAFTHGTSEQRSRWLMAGMNSGDPNVCDTFNSPQL